jgi:hypothetical protein
VQISFVKFTAFRQAITVLCLPENRACREILGFVKFVEASVLQSEIPSSPAPSEDSSAPSSPVTTTPSDDEVTMEFENNDAMKLESPEVRMYKLILENKLETVFPNIEFALRIYLSLMISNCSGERSFSILHYIKNSYRYTMGERRLNDLILLSAEQDIHST